jgi:class 3 adenylate cyclase/tetratricopeptide (TPR) repeat protein
VQRRGDERRIVTVLFGDLVGFTTLSESRDPEQVKNLVDTCFQRLVVDIAAFGGQVDKIVGDAILALFGAPTAHEDDAERAVRAALQMQHTLDAWSQDTEAELRMRIGINTGEVLVGALRAGGDYTAMGDVVNTAQRLQTVAQPGQVVVGQAAHAATRHCVRYTPLGAVHARGREELVDAWIAEEVLLPPGARPGRGVTPLVGRDNELALLNHAVDTAVGRRRAQLLLVMADAGMGKTRLAEEAASVAECAHSVTVLEGRCVPYGEANAWWPVAEALRSTCGIGVDDDIATARERAMLRTSEGISGVSAVEVERVATGLLHVMGYETPLRSIEPTRAREEIVRSLVAFIEGWARQRPVVVLFSDLHWADDRVLELGDVILERLANLPVILMCTGRHSLFERWQPRIGRHNQLVLNLDPLDREAAGALLDAMVETNLDDELREVLLDRSGGNPFFLEELVSLLAEGGQGELPHTLRGLVAARLDSLTIPERALLEDAAVLGRRGVVKALELMAEHAHGANPDVSVALNGLVAKDVLVLDGDKWGFRSELVREVAYNMLTKSDRGKRHYGVATWMESHGASTPADVDRVAHHFATAAQLMNEVGVAAESELAADAHARAVLWLRRAIRQAEESELYGPARRLASEGLELPGLISPEDRTAFLLARARGAIAQRDLASASADVTDAAALVERSGSQAARASMLVVRGDLEQKSGELEASRVTLREAADAFRLLGDERGVAEALRASGMTELFADDAEAAEAAFADALESFKRLGDRRGEAWALQNLAWVAYQRGDADVAEAWLTESVDAFTEIGDSGGLGWAMGLLAYVRYHQGRYADAEALATSVISEAHQRGDTWGEGMCRALLGLLALWTGRTNLGIEHAETALGLFRTMGDWYGEHLCLGIVGRGNVAAGNIDEGFRLLESAVANAAELPTQIAADMASIGIIAAAAQAGMPDRAPKVAADSDEATPDDLGFIDRYVATSLLALQEGDPQRARARLERAVKEQGAKLGAGYAGAALALARAAAGDPDGALLAANTVNGSERATYADRVMAMIAGGLAAAQQGDGTRSTAMLRTARELIDSTEDVLTQAVVRLAEARAAEKLGEPGAAEALRRAHLALSALGVSQPGWDTAFQLAVSPT